MKIAALAILLSLGPAVLPTGLAAQQKSQLAGQVLGDDGQALSGATVRVRRVRPEAAPEVTGQTDRDGRFLFEDVVPGWYDLSASKPGYASLAYGAIRPRDAGTPVVVSSGTPPVPLVMHLPRMASVSGLVRRPDGTPLGGINVAVIEPSITAGGYRMVSAVASALTDDTGTFRINDISPGSYFLKATPPRAPISSMAAANAERRTRERLTGYAPTFYPSSGDEQGATRLVLSSGDGREGADILLLMMEFAQISGRVVDAAGVPLATGQVVLVQPESAATITTAPVTQGAFVLSDVPPGEYLVRVTRPASAAGPELRARADVTVRGGSDVLDVWLPLRPTGTVSGRVVFRGDSPSPAATQFRVTLADSGLVARPSTSGVAAPLAPDGAFVLAGVESGVYRVKVATTVPAAGPWVLTSALVDQQDVVDSGFEVGVAQAVENVTLTLTDRLGQLSGTVLDSAARPQTGVTIVMYPEDRALWSAFRRRVFATRPATTGQFEIARVPAGVYRVATVRDVEPNEWLLPEFLETLGSGAVRVTIADGSATRLDLVVK